MRILFVPPRMIGDAVMSCGIPDALIRRHPEARITVAASPEAAGLFTYMPGLDEVIVVHKRHDHLHWLALWARTVLVRWDMAIDLKGSGLPYVLLARHRFMRRPVAGLRMYRQHAALLGFEPAPVPVAWTGSAERAKAKLLMVDGAPVVGLCPTASWAPKMWSAARFSDLFRRIADEVLPGARAAIFGGPGPREREGAEPLLRALPDAIDLCGALTLPEAVACLQRCSLVVSNDSGLMHLAAAAGAPTVGLKAHAVERGATFAPTGRAATWVTRAGNDMGAISVGDVIESCRAILLEASEISRAPQAPG